MIREIKILNQYAVDNFHVTNQPAFFPLFRDPDGMQSRLGGMLSRNDGPPSTRDTHGISGSGNTYLCTVKKGYSYLCMWMT